MDYEQARFNMIEQQVRTWEVLDQHILDMLGMVHREDFVPDSYKKLALADINIPLLHEQLTMTPKAEARILQALSISATDTILEIGTGCGYLTALLARLGKQVISIDIFPEFTEQARLKLSAHQISNVSLHNADAIDGWAVSAPYDVIAVTGSLPSFSHPLEQQLTLGGRMFIIIGLSPAMSAFLVTRTGQNDWSRESLFETDIPPLIGAVMPARFKF